MIRFRCEHCGGWLSIAEVHATTTGPCPLCKQITRLPEAGETFPAHESDKAQGQPGRQGAALELVREPPEPEEHDDRKTEFYCETQGPPQVIPQPVVPREQEPAPVSRARTIDVLLYPMNFDGLVRTVILAIGFWIVRMFVILFGPLYGLWHSFRVVSLAIMLSVIVAAYTSRYLAHCISDSAKGGTRAPGISPLYTPDPVDMWYRLLMFAGAVALCFGASALYRIFAGTADLAFWVLAAAGVFIFPMALLTPAMFDGIEALNPVLIAASITTTLPAYLGLVARLALPVSLAVAVHWVSWWYGLPRLFSYAAHLYALWVAGHLIGRFYLRHQGELQWDV